MAVESDEELGIDVALGETAEEVEDARQAGEVFLGGREVYR
jgi:hypothetical protein